MYEASEVIALGAANDLIQGIKPFAPEVIDNETKPDRMDRVDDIDESE